MINKLKLFLRKYVRLSAVHAYKFLTLKILYPAIYTHYAKKAVDQKKTIFCHVRKPNNFDLLVNKFTDEGYKIESHILGESILDVKSYTINCIKLLSSVATAKYVFISDASNVMSCFKKRSETTIIQSWHSCGAFKKFGYSAAELGFGATKKSMDKYPYYANLDYVTVSSPETIWAFEEAMNSKKFGSSILPIGVSRTDIFYNEQFINDSFNTLFSLVPKARGKKIVLYAPTFRGKVKNAFAPTEFDIGYMKNLLGGNYFILIKQHPLVKFPPKISDEYADFAQDITKGMDIEQLLPVSDMCISDYSSLVFEYSLYERPIIFFAPDIDEYNDWRGFYYNYDTLTPGPIVKTNLELANCILNLENGFDKTMVCNFREKFMSCCDGNATNRIYDLVTKNHSATKED